MQISGFPITAKLPEDLGFGDRFWYWRGASGRNYIHSIYSLDTCPPLPGAVFVAVRRTGADRQIRAIGRFPTSWDGSLTGLTSLGPLADDANEVHVHLLARDETAARQVLDDLQTALAETEGRFGFQEPASSFNRDASVSSSAS